MQVLQSILQAISALLSGWLMFMLVYQMVLTVLGFRRRTKDYADHAPQSRFLVLVPAHNEEKVIGDITIRISIIIPVNFMIFMSLPIIARTARRSVRVPWAQR